MTQDKDTLQKEDLLILYLGAKAKAAWLSLSDGAINQWRLVHVT